MKNLFLLFASCLFTYNLFAQTTQLKGRVFDAENKSPLANATILVSGTKGTETDKNGSFSIDCNNSTEITIVYMGFESYNQKVTCGEELNIGLVHAVNNLNTVEITATSGQNRIRLYQPISISKLGTSEIKRGAGILLDDAVNINIPGVFMERRTFSAGQQFNIRGYGNGARGTNGINSNFDGQGSKVYLNGIPITDAEGITLMDDIDFGSIGNIEVVKGPAGSLYGLAIAGVVNLKTIKPQPGKISVGQDVLFGSYGLKRYTTHLQISKERSSLIVNYGKQLYDGFMAHTASKKDFVNVLGELNPNQRQSITCYAGFSNSYDERNGELTTDQFKLFDYSGNPSYIKNNAHSNIISFRTGVGHTYKFSNSISNSTSVFGTGLISNVSSAGGWTDKSSINYGLRSTFDTKVLSSNGFTLTGITGVEAQAQNAQLLGYPMSADSFNLSGYNLIGALRSDQYYISKTMSLFSEWTLAMPGDLSVTAGLGYSSMGIDLNDRFYVASNNNPKNPNGTHKPSQYKNNFNNMFSPHIAINKVILNQVSVYASFSKAFKAPVSSYFFIPLTGEVITGLKPEKGAQFEIGSKGSLLKERLNYDIAFFSTTYTDKMTTVAVPNATNTATSYVYVANGGKQKNTGLEVSLRATVLESENFIKAVNPFINLAYSHFRYGLFKYQQLSADKKSITEVDYTDKIVAGVPPITFNAGIDFVTTSGLYANATYSYRDKMYYTSDNKNESNTFQLLNTKIGFAHEFNSHIGIDAYFGVNNITGNQNYAMVFLNQLPDAYLPAPREANFFGGLNLKYTF
ncbi:MAG: TonB-dependent receptor [Saprospiraceae bacterium]